MPLGLDTVLSCFTYPNLKILPSLFFHHIMDIDFVGILFIGVVVNWMGL